MNLPRVKVAAAHVAPVFLNRSATLEKAAGIIKEAAANGAQLVVFPEAYIPAFPVWAALWAPIYNHDYFARLAENAMVLPGKELDFLCKLAARHAIFVSMGITEKSSVSVGCLWNTQLLISDAGVVLNHHRKLVPTYFEKMVWASGDGAGLRVSDTSIGKIGGLICGENTNPLARYSLMAQGEQIHISTYPPIWPTRGLQEGKNYDLAGAIKIRAGAHSFEAKAFNIVASGFMDREMRDNLVKCDAQVADLLDQTPKSVSMIIGPTGEPISEILSGSEGILYQEIDLNLCVEPKQFHDVVGYYNRFDVFDLKVNRKRLEPIEFVNTDDAFTASVIRDEKQASQALSSN